MNTPSACGGDFYFSKSAPFGTAPVGFLTLEERLVEADTRAAYFQNACEELLQVNKHLEERIAALERSLGLNSRTSGKPPALANPMRRSEQRASVARLVASLAVNLATKAKRSGKHRRQTRL